MKFFFPWLVAFFLWSQNPLNASVIYASDFGWSGVDDTQALFDAFTYDADTLYVDLQAGDWVTGPLIFDNNVHDKMVIFERGVKVRALAGAYDNYLYNGLFTFINCSGVSLMGYGAVLQMNKQEYINLNDGSEWRHVIALSGCSDFDVFGLELLDSGGDGIEISGIWQQAVPSTNIHIRDCRIDNNYRQGISVTSAENVLIEHCEITNTSGTPPAFGIDLEPDNAYDFMSGIEIRHCRITGNEGGGVLFSFWNLDDSSPAVSVDVRDCYIGGNQNEGIFVDVNSAGPVAGYAKFERCIVENQPGSGIFSNKRESLALIFNELVIREVGTQGGSYDMPIFIQKQYDYSGVPVGNVRFNRVFIDDHLFDRDFLNISHWGGATQVEEVSGDFWVYNPNGLSYSIEGPLENVNITAQGISSLPVASLDISTNDNIAYEEGADTTTSFVLTRSAADLSFPMAVFLDVAGTADNRLDYHYFPYAVIVPGNFSSREIVLTAIKDELQEPAETIDLTVLVDAHYTVNNATTQLMIGDFVMPVEFVHFDVVLSQDARRVLLEWTAVAEFGAAGFEVQRMSATGSWYKIGWLDAKGSVGHVTHYFFEDEHPFSGVNYYRLRQVDFNGAVEYSRVVSIFFEEVLGGVTFYPNPVADKLFVDLLYAEALSYGVYNLAGKLMTAGVSTSYREIDVKSWPSGVYLLRIKDRNGWFWNACFVKE